MALANYMGGSGGFGLLGVGNVNYADLSKLGRQPAASRPTTTKPQTGKPEDVKGYKGDADYQHQLDRAFQSEYKKGLAASGNDPSWFHQTDKYSQLVNMYQRDVVANRASAEETVKSGEAYRANLAAAGNGTHANQIAMTWDDNTQSFVPLIDARKPYDIQRKGEWLQNTMELPNVGEDGVLTTPNWDWNSGDMKTLHSEIAAEMDKVGHRLDGGGYHTVDNYETGNPTKGTDVSIKKTYDRTWSHKDNIEELWKAADYLQDNLSQSAKYAMAQQDWDLARRGKAWVPDTKDDGSIKLEKDGSVKFKQIELTKEQLSDPEFMAGIQQFSPIRHVQGMRGYREIREDKSDVKKTYDEDRGYAYGADGEIDETKQIFESAQYGIWGTPPQPTKIYQTKNGKQVPHTNMVHRRNKSNAPGPDFALVSDMMFGKPVGELISRSDPTIIVGNTSQKLNLTGPGAANLMILDMIDFGEQQDPNDMVRGKDGKMHPKIKKTIKVRVAADDDELSEYGLQWTDENNQLKDIVESTMGYDSFGKGIGDEESVQKIIGGQWVGDMEDLVVMRANGDQRTTEELNRLNPEDLWGGEGRSGVVFELEFVVDDFLEYDKWIYQGTKTGTQDYQGKLHGYGVAESRQNTQNFVERSNASVDLVEQLNKLAEVTNVNFTRQ